MRVLSELMSLRRCRSLIASGAIAIVAGGLAQAQNLDQGKSATKLFADNCAVCHHRARGLAKGRFNLALFLFLQKHYTSNAGSAWALTSYLESLDSPQRGRPRAAATKPSAGASPFAPRPPAPVPGR